MKLPELIEAAGIRALTVQDSSGAMPAGHNGPYIDPETPVRNTAHWLVTFSHLANRDRPDFREAADRCAAYLMSAAVIGESGAWENRAQPGKDRCNGLIGPAWAIEGLASYAEQCERPAVRKATAAIFLRHPFNYGQALWSRLEPDGTVLSPDATWNHQLWFAAAGALIRDAEVDARVLRFLDRIPRNFSVHPDGLIVHRIHAPTERRPDRWLRAQANRYLRPAKFAVERDKELGYHAFNLYAFALLCRRMPDHPCWRLPAIRAALAAVESTGFQREIAGSRYAFPYNPPGWELAFPALIFDLRLDVAAWLQEQIRRSWNEEMKATSLAGHDPHTDAARIYEACRIVEVAGDG